MSESIQGRARAAYVIAWVPMTALVVTLLLTGGLDPIAASFVGVGLCVPFALVGAASYYLARAMPLDRVHRVGALVNLLGAALVAGGAWAALAWVVAALIPGETGRLLAARVPALLGTGAAYFAISLAYHYLVLAFERVRRAERRTDEVRLLKREAELRALRAQIDPHFLFNSLNSVAALTVAAPHEAREMCRLLSEFFRATTRLSSVPSVSLGEELELARRYLDIERVRFDDRLELTEDVAVASRPVRVPPLLLQPLVENAVKHGIAGLDEPGAIALRAERAEARVRVAVENDFDPDAPRRPGEGRGLALVDERLRSYYGGRGSMVVTKEEGRFRVELDLPADGPAEER